MDDSKSVDNQSELGPELELTTICPSELKAGAIRLVLDGIQCGCDGGARIPMNDFLKVASVLRRGQELVVKLGHRIGSIEPVPGGVILHLEKIPQRKKSAVEKAGEQDIDEALAELITSRSSTLTAAAAASLEDCPPPEVSEVDKSHELSSKPEATAPRRDARNSATDAFVDAVVSSGIRIQAGSAEAPRTLELPAKHDLVRLKKQERLEKLHFRVECVMPNSGVAFDAQRRQLFVEGFDLAVGDRLEGAFVIGSPKSYRAIRLKNGAEYVLNRDGQKEVFNAEDSVRLKKPT